MNVCELIDGHFNSMETYRMTNYLTIDRTNKNVKKYE